MAKGYTKFDNDYLLYLSQLAFSASEFRVLLFILRQSACYKRDYTKECSASYIAEGTGLSTRQAKRSLKSLIEKKYIYLDVEHSSKVGHSWYVASDKLGFVRGQTWSFRGDKNGTDNIPVLSHKEITVDNSKIKEEREKASPTFFINDMSIDQAKKVMEDMTEEDKAKFLKGELSVSV